MVKYPTSVKLADSNKAENVATSKTAGVPMEFSVTKKDGTTAVSDTNIGAGLSITASASNWTGTNIAMAGTSGEVVNMQLTSSTDAFLEDAGTMATLTTSAPNATGYASLSSDSKPVSGRSYTQTVTWTVTKN